MASIFSGNKVSKCVSQNNKPFLSFKKKRKYPLGVTRDQLGFNMHTFDSTIILLQKHLLKHAALSYTHMPPVALRLPCQTRNPINVFYQLH